MIYRNQAEAGPGDRTSRTRKSPSASYGHEICGGIICDGFIGETHNIGKGTIKNIHVERTSGIDLYPYVLTTTTVVLQLHGRITVQCM